MKTRAWLLLLATSSALAQGDFQNLDFESATVSQTQPPGPVNATDALPGWTVYYGTNLQLMVGFNNLSLGATWVSLVGTNQGFGAATIDGAFSVVIEGGFSGTTSLYPTAAIISQTGLVPSTARSLFFKAQPDNFGVLTLSLGGVNIPYFTISNGPNYTLYGANIAAFANQTVPLQFAASRNPGTAVTVWNVDSIQFSASTSPEPSALTLVIVGAALLSWRILRRLRGRCRSASLLVLLGTSSALAQGTFQNLDFEDATIIPIPTSPYYPHGVYVSDALPGWTCYYGTYGITQVIYDDISLGAPSISIHDTNGYIGLISGQYTAFLQAGTYPNSPPANVSLAQTGVIPLDARSIRFRASGALSVSVQGQAIPISALGSGPNYTVYGGNISQFAGQTVELTMTTVQSPNNLWASSSLDDIVFSPIAIPEPSVVTLVIVGAAILSWRVLRRWRRPCQRASLLVLLVASSALAQGTFQNLDFEAAEIVLDTGSVYYPSAAYATNALPGWTVYAGGIPYPPGLDVLYNDMTLSGVATSIHDTNSRVEPVLQGQFTVLLQGGILGQTGQVPSGSHSISFFGSTFGAYTVSFAGQSIPVSRVATGPNYGIFAGDISSHAGQTGELRILGGGLLDNITFSPSIVPEPSAITLVIVGAAILSWRVLRPWRARWRCASLLVLLTASAALAQGTFQNLDFEAANIPPNPGTFIPFTNALPGWMGSLGPYQAGQALYNGVTLGFAEVSILDRTRQSSNYVISGNFTAVISTGWAGTGFVSTAISQSGLIPVASRSLTFAARFDAGVPSDLALTLDSQAVPFFQLGSGPNFVTYGADVSGFAGTTAELRFTAQPLSGSYVNVFLDDIQFSPATIPEPRVLTLSALATALIIWRQQFRPGSTKHPSHNHSSPEQ